MLRGRKESGSVALTFALSMFVLGGFVVATLVIGRLVLERRELQSAADALAIGGAFSVQQLGQLNGHLVQTSIVLPNGPRNTRLQHTAKFEVIQRNKLERRIVVKVTVGATLDTKQNWPTFKRLLGMEVESYAQVNEVTYGEIWPAVTVLIDGSKGMKDPMLGSQNKSAYSVLAQLVQEYVVRRLPVRTGIVVFNEAVVQAVNPPTDKDNETVVQPIINALNNTILTGQTNTTAGLERGRQQLNNILEGGRNLLLASDGEPTLGGPCPPQEQCHITEAETKADQVRKLVNGNPSDGVALFTVEIRRSNWDPNASTHVMEHMAGAPMSDGNDLTMNTPVTNVVEIEAFLTEFTKSICAFGPLDPGPGAVAKDCRTRRVLDKLYDPQRVFAFLRLENHLTEVVIPRVLNRDLVPNQQGFEYAEIPGKGSFVILTLASCQALGKNPDRRLVVRWDEPQLVEEPRSNQVCCHAISAKICP